MKKKMTKPKWWQLASSGVAPPRVERGLSLLPAAVASCLPAKRRYNCQMMNVIFNINIHDIYYNNNATVFGRIILLLCTCMRLSHTSVIKTGDLPFLWLWNLHSLGHRGLFFGPDCDHGILPASRKLLPLPKNLSNLRIIHHPEANTVALST